ncbi:MAG: hypothetical protein Q4P72_04210 [Eubacteriales bacterium]|nr:hypothetical protein [Eubacteriales bacterium]
MKDIKLGHDFLAVSHAKIQLLSARSEFVYPEVFNDKVLLFAA